MALPSKERGGTLSGDIASLYSGISSSQIDIKLFASLICAIVTRENDQNIWKEVYRVIAQTKLPSLPKTPPQSHSSHPLLSQRTPWSFNTGNFTDTSEHRNQVDGALKEELLPSLRLEIPDFIPAIFGQVQQLDEIAEKVFDRCQAGETPLYTQGFGWTKWPPKAEEKLVLEWLQELMNRLIEWVNDQGSHSTIHRQIYQGPTKYIDGSPIKRKMDVGITARYPENKNKDDEIEKMPDTPISTWTEILVTGELKSSAVQDRQMPALLDLATYAREVFRAQDRRFVLGFTLCGSLMRLWQFDRSGSSGSSSFDINKDGFRLVQVMLAYLMMNDKQLGLDPTIRQSGQKRYVEVIRNGRIERLILTSLIKKQAMNLAGRRRVGKPTVTETETNRPLLSSKIHGSIRNDLKKGNSSRRRRRKAYEISHGTIIMRQCRLTGKMMMSLKMCGKG